MITPDRKNSKGREAIVITSHMQTRQRHPIKLLDLTRCDWILQRAWWQAASSVSWVMLDGMQKGSQPARVEKLSMHY